MNTSAFVSAVPVARATPFAPSSSALAAAPRNAPVVSAPVRRARFTMVDNNKKSVPDGFTLFSEQINGRAAMMGFVIAIATEAVTGQGILGQLETVVKTVETVLPF